MNKELQKVISEYQEQAEELAEVKEDVLDTKVTITIGLIGQLMKNMFSSVDDYIEITKDKEYFDKQLGEKISSSLKEVLKIKPPTVNVTVDLSPIESIAKRINEQGETLLKLVNKLSLPNGQQNEGLQKLVVSMIEKQNSFIEKGIQQIDYSKQIKEISKSIENNKRPTKWELEGYKERDGKIKITATAKQ